MQCLYLTTEFNEQLKSGCWWEKPLWYCCVSLSKHSALCFENSFGECIHIRLTLLSYRSQSTDFQCKAMDWFLHESKIGLIWVEAGTLHKKWSFPLSISSVNVIKSAVPYNLVTFTEEIGNGKLHFLCKKKSHFVNTSSFIFWSHNKQGWKSLLLSYFFKHKSTFVTSEPMYMSKQNFFQ